MEQEKEKKLLRHLIELIKSPESADVSTELEVLGQEQESKSLKSEKATVDKNNNADSNTGEDNGTDKDGAEESTCKRDAIWNVYGYGLAFHTTSLVLKPVAVPVSSSQLENGEREQPSEIQVPTIVQSSSQGEQNVLEPMYDLLLALREGHD